MTDEEREELRRHAVELYGGGPPVHVDVPEGSIAVHMHCFSHNGHWACYQVHKGRLTLGYSPRSGQVRVLKLAESVTFPWCRQEPDEDFYFRFRSVTVTNDGGQPKEEKRITGMLEAASL